MSLSCLSQDLRAVVKSSLFSQKHEFNLERSLRIVFSFKRRRLVGVFAHLGWIFSGNKASRSVPISKLLSPALTHSHTAVFCLTRFWLETCPQTRPDLWLNKDKGKLSDLKLFRHLEQQTQAVRGKKKTLSVDVILMWSEHFRHCRCVIAIRSDYFLDQLQIYKHTVRPLSDYSFNPWIWPPIFSHWEVLGWFIKENVESCHPTTDPCTIVSLLSPLN